MTDHRQEHSFIPLKEDSPIMCGHMSLTCLVCCFSMIFFVTLALILDVRNGDTSLLHHILLQYIYW